MFRHEGPSRDARKNRRVAGYLAFVAGFVNSGGFVLIHSFTSHVTGSVGRLGHDLATGELAAALAALSLVLGFFGGAFAVSLLLEGYPRERIAIGYAKALFAQGCLLAVFVLVAGISPSQHPRVRDAEAAILCVALGMQNEDGEQAAFVLVAGISPSQHPRVRDAEAAILCVALGMQNGLITRLSGAVVRTTHLTGVVTDLAIESARWYRHHRAKLALPPLLSGRVAPRRPSVEQTLLLSVIILAFLLGTVLGALLTLRASRWSMALPSILVLVLSAYAYSQRNTPASIRPPPAAPDSR